MNSSNAVSAMIMLIIGVGVGVMVLILVGTIGGQAYEDAEDDIYEIGKDNTATVEFVMDNVTTQDIGYDNLLTGTLTVVSGADTINLDNFTIDYTAGTFLLAGDVDLNGSKANATFDWQNMTLSSSINRGITSSFEALEKTGDYLPITVIAVLIAVVLTLILGMGGFASYGGAI